MIIEFVARTANSVLYEFFSMTLAVSENMMNLYSISATHLQYA